MGHLRILFLRQRASFARRTILLLAALALLGSANGLDITTTPEGRQRVFDALVDTFRTHYWNEDHLDWDAWADRHRDAALAAESRSAFDSVLRRMVAGVADNHSSWVGLARGTPDSSGT